MTLKKIQKGFTLIELMIVVAIIGLLAALAIPNFLKFQARAKTSEAKTNLKGLFTAQKSYLAEHDAYAADYDQCGFTPERGNRYALWMGPGTTLHDRTVSAELVGIAPTLIEADTFRNGAICSASGGAKCTTTGATITFVPAGSEVAPAAAPAGGLDGTGHSFSAFAYGDIDSDSSIDAWYITNVSSTVAGTAATCVPATTNSVGGTPTQTFNDVDC